MVNQIKFFSFGGGVQSTAVLVLAIQKKLNINEFIFANVGDNAENPYTLSYVDKIIIPLCQKHNVKFTVVSFGPDLADTLCDLSKTDLPIPLYFPPNGSMGYRNCTKHWKIMPIQKYIRGVLRRHKKETGVKPAAQLGIGISMDEIHRMKPARKGSPYTHFFPLIDLNMSRKDCEVVIESFGLPVPPKSSCFFCPYKTISEWKQLHKREPELFEKAAYIEQKILEKRKKYGKDPAYISKFLRPLSEVKNNLDQYKQQELFYDECDGYCWT